LVVCGQWLGLRGLLIGAGISTVMAAWTETVPAWLLLPAAALVLGGVLGSPLWLRIASLAGYMPAVASAWSLSASWKTALAVAYAWFWVAGNAATWSLAAQAATLAPWAPDERRRGTRLAVLNGGWVAGFPLVLVGGRLAFRTAQLHWPLLDLALAGWLVGGVVAWCLLYLLLRDLWVGWGDSGASLLRSFGSEPGVEPKNEAAAGGGPATAASEGREKL
jgi:hypothetical protein